ncbi:hypothetical protein SUGI_0131000 [Cryptomeria japonica]|uniref:protein SMALL AUXIN UP-REGULATED RNA 12 n=1 Tax=Cryptomeria japonica TaxID=3369 RepID=UPI002408A2A5|nr:protein SMALL AUXIN UP-REGULATED RNA 12 [Cryptomeria japonica]GLJ10576.1 hypothetical protein SUGI_0131000 [Cryptomeria japonica]
MNSSRIRQIVQLRQVMNKWRTLALSRKVSTVNGCALSGRIRSSCDSDEECCRSLPPPPADVPEGYLAVYVGKEEMRRFIIPTSFLSRPAFRRLLDQAEEEFGFDYQGVLTIPCEMAVFEKIVKNEGYEEEKEVVIISCKDADVRSISSSLLQESSIA